MLWRLLWLGLVVALGCVQAKEEARAPVQAQEEGKGGGRDEPFVADILRKMHRAYEGLEWYSDQGEVVTQHSEHRGRMPPEKILRFRTHFVRPDRLHFEFEEEPWPTPMHPRSKWSLWWNGGEATTWWTVPRELHTRSLKAAIAAGTGISDRSVRTVPSILLPELGGPAWGNPDLKGRETVDGRECFVIDFDEDLYPQRPRGMQVLHRVWVDTRSYLVRKIRLEISGELEPYGHVRSVSVTTYTPDIENKPPDSVFRPDHPDPETDPTIHMGEVTLCCCNSCEKTTCSGCKLYDPAAACAPPRITAHCSGQDDTKKCTPTRAW